MPDQVLTNKRLYNVDSPGGYQMTGMTLPGVDILGTKKGYTPNRPWLFEDFDQITFYRVTEEEYEKQLALFNSGRYEYECEEVVFDMEEHNRLLRDTKEEVARIREEQREAQREMDELESMLLEKWGREKAERGVPVDMVEELLKGMLLSPGYLSLLWWFARAEANCVDPEVLPIEAPLNANVWKVEVNQGDNIGKDQVVIILEAMKLEIAVRADPAAVGTTIEKILVQQGDSIEAGKPLLLARKASK